MTLKAEQTEQVLEIARQVLRQESAAVSAAADRLGNEILSAVDLILTSRGRLIVCGMGKSGLVGRKISSTLSSTGTPSFFLHPGEALHGDLGMVTDEDVVLLLSNSGETDEILRLIPFLRRIGARTLALTGNPSSTLARMSDVTLNAGVTREACTLNLAPTSSTTVAMALGDSLAITLLEVRGFKEKDFARLHPSGNLGKKFLKVRDLMHAGDTLPLTRADIPLREGVSRMSRGTFGAIVVVDAGGKLLGIVTDGDLRRYLERTPGSLDIPVADMMTRSPRSIGPERLAMEALKIMEQKSITSLPVTENDVVVGFLHLHDILKSRLV